MHVRECELVGADPAGDELELEIEATNPVPAPAAAKPNRASKPEISSEAPPTESTDTGDEYGYGYLDSYGTDRGEPRSPAPTRKGSGGATWQRDQPAVTGWPSATAARRDRRFDPAGRPGRRRTSGYRLPGIPPGRTDTPESTADRTLQCP